MTSRCFSVCLLIPFAFASLGLAEDSWPQFRGAGGTGIVREGKLPLSWDQKNNVAWRTPVPGQGWASPVIDDGKIYLTAAVPQSEEEGKKGERAYDLKLMAIDAASGKQIFAKTLISQTMEQFKRIHGKNSHASPTPIVEGDHVFCHFGFQGTVCTDLQGNIVWKNRDLSFPPVHGNGGSPVISGDMLIFTCDGAKEPYVAALNKKTGKLAWKCKRPIDAKKKFSFATPTVIEVNGKTQVIAPGSDCVMAIQPQTGDILWFAEYDGYSVTPKPIYADGLVFVCSGFDRGYLLAIDPTGSGNVTDSHVRWQIDRGVPKTPSLLVKDSLLYLISDAGVAMCLDTKSGDRIWQERVGGKYSASPILFEDRIYFTNEAGLTTVIQTGEEYKMLAENDLEERTLASIAPYQNSFIIRTADALYRIAGDQ